MVKQILNFFSIITFILYSLNASAQLGKVDTTYLKTDGANNTVTGGLELPDNSLFLTGRFTYINRESENFISRVDQNGIPISSFNPGTGPDSIVNVAILQTDGKIIIGGSFNNYNGAIHYRIARIDQNGTIDPTYNTGIGFDQTVYCFALQPDGKLLVGGDFTYYNGTLINKIVRINTDGTIDNTFNVGTGCNSGVYAIMVQNDGKIVLAGDFTTFNGNTVNRVVRLNTDGSFDNTYNVGTGSTQQINAGVIQTDGKVVLAGFFTSFNGYSSPRIIRLKTDGKVDSTYASGTGFNSNVNELAILPDNYVYAVGNFTTFNGLNANRVLRIQPNGSQDFTFFTNGGPNLSCNTVFTLSSGKVIVGGTFTAVDSFAALKMVKFNADGTKDHAFSPNPKFNGNVNCSANQSSGKLVVGGNFIKYNEIDAPRICRLLNNGDLDPTFITGSGFDGNVNFIVIRPDDKIIVGGNFNTYNGFWCRGIVQLNANGSIDNSFVVDTGFNNAVNVLALESNGNVVAGGAFTSYKGNGHIRMIRLLPNGTPDNTFNLDGTGFNNTVSEIHIDRNNRYLVGGTFTQYNGVSKNRILRLNNNGSNDGTFNIGTGSNNTVSAIQQTPDGGYLIGGTMTTYNGVAVTRLLKIDSLGVRDAAFAPSVNNTVSDIEILQNQTVLIAGNFTSVNGLNCLRIAPLNLSGALDTANYFIGLGAENSIFRINNDTVNKKIFLCGSFIAYQGFLQNKLAQIRGSNIELVNDSIKLGYCAGGSYDIYFNTLQSFDGSNNITIELSNAAGSFATPTIIGSQNLSVAGNLLINVTIPANTPTGDNYRIRIKASSPIDLSGISKPFRITNFAGFSLQTSGPTSFCPGNSITLTAIPAVNYNWSNNATTSAINASAAGIYYVQITDSIGCSWTSQSTTVTLFSLPDSSITVSPFSICNEGSFFLNAASGLQYSWSTNASTSQINVTASGSYTVTVTTNNGCVADSTVSVSLNNVPIVLIDSSGATTFCNGGSVTLSSISGFTYNWTNGSSASSITVTESGNYRVTVSDGICTDTSNFINVNVVTTPEPGFTSGLAQLKCAEDTITLTANPGYTYNWSTGSTSQSVLISNPGFVYVTVTGAGNCSAIDTINVQNYGNTVVNITPSISSACVGQNITLNATPGFSNYEWSNGGITPSINITTNNTYSVTVENSNGCTSSNSINFQFNSNPSPAIIVSDSVICQGETATLSSSGYSTYLWSNSSTSSSTTVNSGGAVTVTVTDNNNCSGTATVNITLNSLPVVSVDPITDTCYFVGIPLTLPLIGTPIGGTFSGPGVNSTTFDVPSAGVGTHTISYSYTDNNGCSNVSSTSVDVSVCDNIFDLTELNISVYPNPSNGIFFIKGLNYQDMVSLYTSNGQLVIEGLNLEIIDIQNFASGIYVLNIAQEGKIARFKLLKE